MDHTCLGHRLRIQDLQCAHQECGWLWHGRLHGGRPRCGSGRLQRRWLQQLGSPISDSGFAVLDRTDSERYMERTYRLTAKLFRELFPRVRPALEEEQRGVSKQDGVRKHLDLLEHLGLHQHCSNLCKSFGTRLPCRPEIF